MSASPPAEEAKVEQTKVEEIKADEPKVEPKVEAQAETKAELKNTAETKRERTTSENSSESSDKMKPLSLADRKLQWTRTRTMSTCADGRRIILLAVDPSDNSQIAFDWFLDNVHKTDDYLLIVHCPETPRLPTFSFKSGIAPPLHEWKEILDEMNTKTRKLEEDYESTCIMRKLRYKVRGEAMKNPGEGIIRIADEEKVDLICLGTRGQSGVKRMLLGSVSDYVIRNSSVPVIAVPGKKLLKRRVTLAAIQADQYQ